VRGATLWLGMACSSGSEEARKEQEQERQDSKDNVEGTEDRGDDANDVTGLGQTLAGGIHASGADLAQVGSTEDPGDDAKRETKHQAEDTENEDDGAAMRFESGWRLVLGRIHMCGGCWVQG
jgi:hypothetical protein